MSRNQHFWERENLANLQRAAFQPFCEVRIRFNDDKRNWEEIRPVAQLDMAIDAARIMYISFLRTWGDVLYGRNVNLVGGEIRINEIGSLQGHYFTI